MSERMTAYCAPQTRGAWVGRVTEVAWARISIALLDPGGRDVCQGALAGSVLGRAIGANFLQ